MWVRIMYSLGGFGFGLSGFEVDGFGLEVGIGVMGGSDLVTRPP